MKTRQPIAVRRRLVSAGVGCRNLILVVLSGLAAPRASAAESSPALSVTSDRDTVQITSSSGSTWKAVIDGRRGGVITELRIPAGGENIASNDGSRFEGLCNLVYAQFKETGKDGAYIAKGSLYYFAVTEKLDVIEKHPDRIVVEVTGRAGNQVSPKADVLRYRQRFTFRPDRILCEGEVDWRLDDVVAGSRPELIQLNNMFSPGSVTGEMRVEDHDTTSMPLPESNSKGLNYPEGIEYPVVVEVPLKRGHVLRFRSLRMPDGIVKARYYWNEYPRQIENKRGFAFKAWEGRAGNQGVSFPNDKPIAYAYEIGVGMPGGQATAAAASEQAEGFVALFNGRNMEGWQGAKDRWTVADGNLVYRALTRPKGAAALPTLKLMSAREYADFILRFEFKLGPGTNNGVAVRAPLDGDAAFVGMEIQVIDTEGWPAKLKRFQVHGSIYGVVPAATGHLKPVGEWNREEISCVGRRVKVTLNGVVIVDASLDDVSPIDGQPHPGLARKTGYIGFLGHTGRVEFRNIRIKEL